MDATPTPVIAADAAPLPRSWSSVLLIVPGAAAAGALLGAALNSIDGRVSRDYFAIVMSWDWLPAPNLAIRHGVIDGAELGLFGGVLLAIVAAASSRLRCPPALAARALGLAVVIVVVGWIAGGLCGLILARLRPQLWGFLFAGVPRVNLPRYAWVGGSIIGAYVGIAVGLLIAAVFVHVRWKRLAGPGHGFAVVAAGGKP